MTVRWSNSIHLHKPSYPTNLQEIQLQMSSLGNKVGSFYLLAAGIIVVIAGGAFISTNLSTLLTGKSSKDDIGDEDLSCKNQLRNKTGYDQLVGNTPLVKLHSLSKILKRHIYLKVINTS